MNSSLAQTTLEVYKDGKGPVERIIIIPATSLEQPTEHGSKETALRTKLHIDKEDSRSSLIPRDNRLR